MRNTRKVNRSTVKFLAARRTSAGVDVSADFEAPKSSGDAGCYKVQFCIDPKTKVVLHADFVLMNKTGGGSVFQRMPSMDKQLALAKELRDMFLRLPAWEILRNREPDMRYIIDGQGKER
jgi:hypothetical protein